MARIVQNGRAGRYANGVNFTATGRVSRARGGSKG